MLFLFIVALTISILAVIFALQNAGLVSINFLIWSFKGSLALVLLLSFAAGAMSVLLILFPQVIKKSFNISKLEKKIKDLESKLPKENKNTTEKKDNNPNNEIKVEL